MRKLTHAGGETLIETLVALIVATLVMLFLSTSIIAATRVNKQVEKADTSFNYPVEDTADADAITVTIIDKNNKEVGTASAYQYTDDTGHYKYYKGAD